MWHPQNRAWYTGPSLYLEQMLSQAMALLQEAKLWVGGPEMQDLKAQQALGISAS